MNRADSHLRNDKRDYSISPFTHKGVTHSQLLAAYKTMIISASGWRKICALGSESFSSTLSEVDQLITSLVTLSFIDVLQPQKVLIARDTRPTGAHIAHCALTLFVQQNVEVEYVGISAAPEIMALSQQEKSSHFFYISASHNPVGFNGFKFGTQGAVLVSQEVHKIAERFHFMIHDPSSVSLLSTVDYEKYCSDVTHIVSHSSYSKQRALEAYRFLALHTAQDVSTLKSTLQSEPLGIVGELNGSARSVSIDHSFLEELGVKVHMINHKPGMIVHGIEPEGKNLNECKEALEKLHAQDPSFVLGYVPDNDGDRGNIVYYDEVNKEAVIVEPQKLFALLVFIETQHNAPTDTPQAVIVNGPTSMMVDNLAQTYGFEVFRSEVGEANVVTLGAQKREQGYYVRIIGEGSNGGNITSPSCVRDPLNTLLSLIKLLRTPSLFSLLTDTKEKPSLRLAFDSLPKRLSTEVTSPLAVITLSSDDYPRLKKRYEELFISSFETKKEELRTLFNIDNYRIEVTKGIHLYTGEGHTHHSGGYKVVFVDKDEQPTDFMWMRPSGTEALFRVIVDTLGDDQDRYTYFLKWHRSLVEQADS